MNAAHSSGTRRSTKVEEKSVAEEIERPRSAIPVLSFTSLVPEETFCRPPEGEGGSVRVLPLGNRPPHPKKAQKRKSGRKRGAQETIVRRSSPRWRKPFLLQMSDSGRHSRPTRTGGAPAAKPTRFPAGWNGDCFHRRAELIRADFGSLVDRPFGSHADAARG